MSPEQLVRQVFERVHASDPSIVELFHEDAVRHGQDGRSQHGRAAIGAFYQSLFPTSPPYPEIDQVFIQLPYVGVLLRLPENEAGLRHVIDLFEVEDGAIRTLRVLMEADAG